MSTASRPLARDGVMGSALRGRLATVLLHHLGYTTLYGWDLINASRFASAGAVRPLRRCVYSQRAFDFADRSFELMLD